MLKRTKGRLLLTLLVVTGFAGTLNTASLSTRERKVVILSLKEYKSELIKNLRGLSQHQLNYQVADGNGSIHETLQHIVAEEAGLWKLLESAMAQPAKPEDRASIVVEDEEILNASRGGDKCRGKDLAHGKIARLPVQVILNEFKASRSKQLKYIKTTTEDLRNRVVDSPIGRIDCYQLLLYMALHTNAHLDEISAATDRAGFAAGK